MPTMRELCEDYAESSDYLIATLDELEKDGLIEIKTEKLKEELEKRHY